MSTTPLIETQIGGAISCLAGSLYRPGVSPKIANDFMPHGLDADDESDMTEGMEFLTDAEMMTDVEERAQPDRRVNPVFAQTAVIAGDLDGVTFAIDYKNSTREVSRRRIRIITVRASEDGYVYVYAHCYERDEPRMFRLDRMLSVIDLDGAVHNPVAFFTNELRVPLEQPVTVDQPYPRKSAGVVQRRAARKGVLILCALSRCDGLMHETEVEVIANYITAVCQRRAIPMKRQDREAVLPYIQRQFPSRSMVLRCLHDFLSAEIDDQKLLIRHAIGVMDADGIQHPAEFDMVIDVMQELS